MTTSWDSIWINATILSCEQGYGRIDHAAIAVKENKIAWLGPMQDLSSSPQELAISCHDLQGRCITPGLIDCHTHLVYAGNRAHEFELRLQGVSYKDIAHQGGGIHATVLATRAISEKELLKASLSRAQALLKSGVTTIEIKSGYGLDWPTELKMLRVAKQIEDNLPLTIYRTFLGAHTIPPEFQGKPDDYLDLVCNEMIPRVAKEKLADAVDVFCEKIAFNIEQTKRVFEAAKAHGLAIKCHAEQLSNRGGATLAAHYHALSVDHLEYLDEAGVHALSTSGTVAVLLPGAFYFLQEKQLPPIDLLRQYHIPIAIATDCNPGTSPILSMLLILNMACTLFHLTPEEALLGATKHAAKALGLEASLGTLTVGKIADFIVWHTKDPAELAYYMGLDFIDQLVKAGKIIQ